MRAVIIGGSGATGKALVQYLLNSVDFKEIVLLLRREVFPAHPKLKQIIVDFGKLQDVERLIYGDLAISCLGTTRKDAGSKDAQWKIDHDLNLHFAALAKKNGIPVFVLLSAVNADAGSRIFYNRMKGSLEQHIKALDFSRLIIVQPGGLIRPDTDRAGEKLAIGALRIFNRIGLLRSYEALTVDRVAVAMLRSVSRCREKINVISVSDIKDLSE